MWFMVREFNQRQTFWRRLTRVLAPLVGLTLGASQNQLSVPAAMGHLEKAFLRRKVAS